MIHFVNRQALLDIRCKIARRTSERTVTVVVFAMSVQVPLVRCSEIAHVTLYHRHRVVFDVFGETSFDVGDVRAFATPETIKLCKELNSKKIS